MAKKITGYIKLQLPAGKANPAPPVGPALGQHGVNIMGFCKEFNAKTAGGDMIIPVVITVYADRSFTFILKTPPVSVLLKKSAGLATGKKPGVGLQGAEQEQGRQGHREAGPRARREKMQDMNCTDIEAAMRTVRGTARSMGIDVVALLTELSAALIRARREFWRANGSRVLIVRETSEPPPRDLREPTVGGPTSLRGRPQKGRKGGSCRSCPRTATKVDEAVDRSRKYTVEEACALVKKAKFAKFDETVDLAVRLGVNPKHADQMVRGALVLPHGTGQTVRVLVFAKGEKEREAKEAGADFAGSDDMVAKVSRRLHGLRSRDRDARHDGRRR